MWICPQANGHIQATGIDAKGRKQYRYNDEFRTLRESAKFEHILVFAAALPTIRETVAKDMARHGLPTRSSPPVFAQRYSHVVREDALATGRRPPMPLWR